MIVICKQSPINTRLRKTNLFLHWQYHHKCHLLRMRGDCSVSNSNGKLSRATSRNATTTSIVMYHYSSSPHKLILESHFLADRARNSGKRALLRLQLHNGGQWTILLKQIGQESSSKSLMVAQSYDNITTLNLINFLQFSEFTHCTV